MILSAGMRWFYVQEGSGFMSRNEMVLSERRRWFICKKVLSERTRRFCWKKMVLSTGRRWFYLKGGDGFN
jgi:hypothetical protein